MFKLTSVVLVGLSLLPVSARAQGKKSPGGKGPVESKKRQQGHEEFRKNRDQIRKKIQLVRARRQRGEVVRTHVKVRVKLRNQEIMTGVVRNGRFVEKPRGLEFVRSEMTAKGAGIRIWYYNNTNGYIFIPYSRIKTYRVLKRLSDIEVREIREQIVKAKEDARARGEARRKKLREKAAEAKKDEEAGDKLEELTKKLEEETREKEVEDNLLKLVKEFPPEEGWGDEKLKEIHLRRISIGAFPDKKSRRFVEVYQEWKKGYEIWKKQQDAKTDKSKGKKKDDAKKSPKPAGTEKNVG
ncbi:MAG: hypothetical protein ACE5F1_01210 [Planctomycetota bacterium]